MPSSAPARATRDMPNGIHVTAVHGTLATWSPRLGQTTVSSTKQRRRICCTGTKPEAAGLVVIIVMQLSTIGAMAILQRSHDGWPRCNRWGHVAYRPSDQSSDAKCCRTKKATKNTSSVFPPRRPRVRSYFKQLNHGGPKKSKKLF